MKKSVCKRNVRAMVVKQMAVVMGTKPIKNHTTEIFEYIRRNKGGITRKVGVILGVNDKGVIRIGWSKVNEKLGDKFDSLLGLEYAMKRAMKPDGIPTPKCIKSQLRKFGARTVRYFQDATKLELPV